MISPLKNLIKQYFFPRLLNRYIGNFSSWAEAKKKAEGYDTEEILEKVKKALLKVKRGEAIYERDSVVFDEIEYSWPLLAGLLLAAADNKGHLDIVDFGGSLGSSYFQNLAFLKNLNGISWKIIEQPHFVQTGKKEFEDESLKFFNTIAESQIISKSNIILFSSVLQYLEKPYEILDQVLSSNFDYILIDRTSFISGDKDRLTVQKVPKSIYKASYPAWFISEKNFESIMTEKYSLIANFACLEQDLQFGKHRGFFKGMLYKRKN